MKISLGVSSSSYNRITWGCFRNLGTKELCPVSKWTSSSSHRFNRLGLALQDLDFPSDLFMHVHVLHLSLVDDLDSHLMWMLHRVVLFHMPTQNWKCGFRSIIKTSTKPDGQYQVFNKAHTFCPVVVCSAILTYTKSIPRNPLPCRQGVHVTNRIEKFHKTLRICVSTEATSQLQEPFWAGFFDAHQQTIHADSYIYIIYHVSYLTNTTYPDVNIYHFGSTPFPAALPKVPTPSVLEIWNQGIRTNRPK